VNEADGLIWWSTPTATVGLVVAGGDVVACPPYARKWAAGRDARDLWRQGIRQGAHLEWIPDPPQRLVAQWFNGLFGTLTVRRIKLMTNDLTWQVWVRDGRTEGALRYPDEAQARQEVDLLLTEGQWRELRVN
jgi:hypothetical protein